MQTVDRLTDRLRFLEPLFELRLTPPEDTLHDLRAARIHIFPEWYAALSYVAGVVAGAITLPIACVVALNVMAGAPAAGIILLSAGVGLSTFLAVRLGFLVYPRATANARGRRIDAEYPSVLILCYALARGGVRALEIFRIISEEEETYGEISVEFRDVVRATDELGLDLTTALERVAETTPSRTLRGFFEGLVTIMNSGADPRDFFKRQAETRLSQAEIEMEAELDQAGLLAELYVSGLLVLPLLLIVVLSVMSSISSGGGGSKAETMISLITFALMPFGTIAYLLLVEMMLPPEKLNVPELEKHEFEDFGVDVLPADAPVLPPPPPRTQTLADLRAELRGELLSPKEEARIRRRLALESARKKLRRGTERFIKRALEKPVDAVEVSGSAALLVILVGGGALWTAGYRGYDLAVAGTGLVFAGVLVAVIPVNVFHELRLRRARSVDAALPDLLNKLSGFNERGIGLLRSFEILGHATEGNLAREMRGVARDVSWTGNLGAALRRMRTRVRTRRMMKLGVLFERASAATGNIKEVLEIAARDVARTENLRNRKRQSMMTYVVVIYVVFGVFLYVVYMISSLFFGDTGLAAASGGATSAGSGQAAISGGLQPDTAKLLFFHAVLVQSVCSGVVAGRLGEGHLLSGLKHAAILGALSWAIFRMGVVG